MTLLQKLALILAFVAAPAVAAAQHAPSPDDVRVEAEAHTGGHGEAGGEGHAPAGAVHHDPSHDFNWLNNPLPLGGDSYKNKDQAGGPLGDGKVGDAPESEHLQEQPMSVPFFWVLLNFGILLFVFGWKGAPALRQMAAKRSDEIKAALDEAARLRKQAEDKLGEYSAKLKAAETEIDHMIKSMRADAESEKQRIIAAAEAQAAVLKKDAEQRIAAEIARARHELQREVVAAATTVAEKVLRDKTSAADQTKLVDTFLRDVTGAPADARR